MATISPTLNFEYRGIGTILKVNRLKVPLNQREYSWEETHIVDLFQDLANAITKKKSAYFLGTIVVSKSKDVPEVVDGQQRLATTTILLAAIRDYFLNKNESMLQTSVETDFLTTIDRDRKENVPRLTLNVDDNEYFKNRILSLPQSKERNSIKETKESHKRINLAAELAEKKVKDIVSAYSERNANDVLVDWLRFIEYNATVVLLTVPDEMNAFMMFETLNDRGLKTSQADLLKNYLFREAADERLDEAQQKWSSMISKLESLDVDDIIMTYLRHMTITQFGPTREKDVFDKIQKDVSGRAQAIEFLERLADYADSYNAILTPSHNKWNGYNNQMKEIVSVLKELRVQQIRPLMLAVAQNFSIIEAEKAFSSFIFWTVRFLIVGGMRGGQLEEAYGLRAHDVIKGKITTSKQLSDALLKVIPNDAEFEDAFSSARVSQHYLARYYLRAIEAYLRKESNDPELVPVQDTEVLNLEHILPQELGESWSHFDSDTASAYVKRLGNLTLMKSKPNSDFGNASFLVKRKEFENSNLLLNKQIYEMTDEKTIWTSDNIIDRQKKLASYAIKTWPLGTTKTKTTTPNPKQKSKTKKSQLNQTGK